MKLLDTRAYYKPFSYPWAYAAYKKQNQMHWVPEEVSLQADVHDWKHRLTASERNLLTQLFRFFTQGDIAVANGYNTLYLPLFNGHPEVAMMMNSFAGMEAVHVDAYSQLLETIGMDEAEYKAFHEYEVMVEKHNFATPYNLWDVEDNPYDIAKGLAVYSAFTEGMQLFSSFAMLLSFSRLNKMSGMGQIVTWSIRDEQLHVNNMIRLFNIFCAEYNINKKNLHIEEIADTMVLLEDKFIDLAFELGPIEGLAKEEVKQYIRYICNIRLEQLGREPIYTIEGTPLEWMKWVVEAPEHANFFENRVTEYAKGQLDFDNITF